MKTATVIFFLIITILLLNITQIRAQCHFNDWTALKVLYESTNGDNWTNNIGWEEVTGDSPTANCDLELLHGIILDSQGQVESINLDNNQLNGNIPAELVNLSNLLDLRLYNNQLNGSIPAELGNLSNLLDLSLKGNQLSGSIPAELGNLISLKYLNLDDNQLTGNIPVELGNLSNLNYLFLGDNQLSGSIPVELGNLSNLVYFRLYNNQLSGSIPVELSNLSELTYLDLFYNQLSGSIPAEIGNLSNLVNLDLAYNQFSGSIPAELGNLSKLVAVWLQNNKLSDNIPAELGNLSELGLLWLDNNQFEGSIPAQLSNLSSLTKLRLQNNKLSGSIPAEFGNLSNLSIDNNYFSCTDVQSNFQQLNQVDNFYYAPQYFKPENYETIKSNVFDTLSINQSLSIKIDFPFDTVGLTYQWYRNETILSRATQALLNFDTIQLNNVGKYTLQVISENCLPDGSPFEMISEPIYTILKGYDLYGQPVEYDQIMVEFDNAEETEKNELEILFENGGWVAKECNCSRELYLWQFPTTEAAAQALLEIDKARKRIKKKSTVSGGFNNVLEIEETENTANAYKVINESLNIEYHDSALVFILDSGLDNQNFDYTPFIINSAPVDNCYSIESNLGYGYIDSANTIVPVSTNYQDELWHGTYGFQSITENLDENHNIKVVPLKVFDKQGTGSLFNLTCALYHTIDHNADVVNISAGYQGQPSGILENAINLAREKGIFITAAAGNDSIDIDTLPQYPAYYASQYHLFEIIDASGNVQLDSTRYDNVISIASINENNFISPFSNVGKQATTLAAYGEKIFGYGLGASEIVASGTSMATYFVTKELALEIASNKNRNYQQIWNDFEQNRLVKNNALDSLTRTGKQLKVQLEEAVISGCTDENNCHYFKYATIDDGSCLPVFIDASHIDENLIHANDSILSTKVIKPLDSVIYKTRYSIILEKGFEVKKEAAFIAEIDDCEE